MKKKVSKAENSHLSMDIKPLEKDRSWVGVIEASSYNFFPGKTEWRKRLAYSLYLWAEEDDAFQIQDFCTAFKIPRRTLYEWYAAYEDIRQAMDDIKLILGARRLKGALMRRLDKEVVFKDIHKLDPEYLEINKYHAELKKNEGPAEIKQIVEYREITSNLKAREVGVKDDKLSEEESAKSQDTV